MQSPVFEIGDRVNAPAILHRLTKSQGGQESWFHLFWLPDVKTKVICFTDEPLCSVFDEGVLYGVVTRIYERNGYLNQLVTVESFDPLRAWWRDPNPNRRRSDHKTLFVTADAPPEVVKAAYRALMQLHHPDQGGDEVTAKRINNAYDRIKAR